MRFFVGCALAVIFGSLSLSSSAEELRWGADTESGAPYAFQSSSDVNQVVGFEAELVQALAKELGMTLKFVQNDWDGLVEGLDRGDYDIIANGVEITPERREVVRFSIPYYLTSEALAVRQSNQDIQGIEDLKGKKVGTLGATLADRILRHMSFPVDVVNYAEEIHLYNDLALGRLDAVLMDEPVAIYYARPNRELKIVGPPVGKMSYGIAMRPGDKALAERVDRALAELIKKGTLREILERWGIWNEMTAHEWGVDPTPRTPPVAYDEYLKSAFGKKTFSDKVHKYVSILPALLKGAVMTLKISLLSMMLAMLVGLIVALARLYGPEPFSFLALAFVELFRGTPLLIQLFLIFYGLPHLGLKLNPFAAAVIGLGLNYGACEAENYRAGILSIPRAQMDAAEALGMGFWQSLRYVIFPQALRVALPPITNDFIALLKDSSLVSVISMVELTTAYGQLASTHFDYLGIGLIAAAIYFLIGLPFVRLSRYFEAHMGRATRAPSRQSK